MTKEEVEFLTAKPRFKRPTRKQVFTVGSIGIAAFATLLIINDQVQKLKKDKAEDSPETAVA